MNKLIRTVMSSITALTIISGSTICNSAIASYESNDAIGENYLYDFISSPLNSSTFYYTPYDYYDEYSIAPTDHYLATIVPAGTSLATSFSVYLYLNTNILPGSPTSTDKIIISPDYSPYLSLSGITSATYLPTCTRVTPSFTRLGNPSLPAPLFSYHLDDVENNSIIDCEYDVHCMTSMYASNPTSNIYTNKGNSLVKVIYALGDVDKDGDLDNDDVLAIQKYCLSLAQADSNRSDVEAAYDEIAFKLAADFNQDGTVNMPDAVPIIQYLASQE